MSEEQSMIQKCFAEIGKRFDGIEQTLKRTKPVPPQPSIRNYPSGTISIRLTADDGFSYVMDDTITIEDGEVSLQEGSAIDEENINTNFVRYSSVSELLAAIEDASSPEYLDETFIDDGNGNYENFEDHFSQLFSTYDNVGIVDLDTGTPGFCIKFVIAYNTAAGAIQHIEFFPDQFGNYISIGKWTNPNQSWTGVNGDIDFAIEDFDGGQYQWHSEIVQIDIYTILSSI